MRIQLKDHFTYKRLISFTLPSIVTMIFTSLYGIVDGYFVSNFAGKNAFAALNLVMPFLMIMAAVGFMLGTGGTAIVANALGRGHSKKAQRYFSLIVYTAFLVGIILEIFGMVLVRPIARWLGAEGALLENSVVYARIVLLAHPFYMLQLLFHSFLIAAEKPGLGLKVTIASGVTNMILDAVLVGLLPQEYKLSGAAAATAISEVIGGGVPLIYFSRKNDSLLKLGKTSWNGKVILKASTNGSSEFMSNIAMSLVGMLYNVQLLKFAGEDGVAAYGVMMYVSMIFSAVFIGYSVGVAPVISFHDGARNNRELLGILKQSLILMGVFGSAMVILSQIGAKPLSILFVSYDEKLLTMTVHGFHIFAASFIFMSFAIFSSGFFTALNDGLTSALISFLRTLIFEAGAVWFLPMFFGIDGIWTSVIVAELMACMLSAFFIVREKKKISMREV